LANITAQEPIRWQIDQASFDSSGLIVIPPSSGLDCTTSTAVKGFVVTGSEPAGTSRKVGFTVDGVLHKLGPDGSLTEITSVEEQGNTVAELEAITDIPGFIGKQVGVTIYLYAEDPEGSMPSISIKAIGESSSQQTVKVEYSSVYNLGSDSKIIKLEASTTVTNGGSAVVEASVDGGSWGTLTSFAGVTASSVQFRATLTAPSIGSSSARINQASILYRSGSGLVSGVGEAEIVSITEDWHTGVRQCRMTVKHARLIDSIQRAFVSFRDTPQLSTGEEIGVGAGEQTTYQLENVIGVKYDSVRLYFDSQRVYSNYEVNTEVGRITCTAPEGAVITADYEYGWTPEVWHEMEQTGTIPAIEYDTTEYKFVLPLADVAKSVCTVKIVLEVVAGHIDGEIIGTGTDIVRTYRLSHIVRDGHLTLYADDEKLPSVAWALSSDAKSVRVAAAAGATLTAHYDWISETPVVDQFIGVFAE
jgi:hypothetical protein